MQQPILTQELSVPRLVADFDGLADWMPVRHEREDPYRGPHETTPSQETEFTTEWQIVTSADEVYLD